MGRSNISLLDIVFFPVSFPLRELVFLAEEIRKLADRELFDPEFLQRKLVELQLRYEMGEIGEIEYRREWDVLSARLRAVNEARRAEEGGG